MNIKHLLFGICLIVAAVYAADTDQTIDNHSDLLSFFKDEWSKFKSQHNRTYTNLLEAGKRFGIFVENVRSVLQHNKLFTRGNATFEQHINLFADLTSAEVTRRNGFKPTEHQLNLGSMSANEATRSRRVARDLSAQQPLPTEVNWVRQGAVAAVLDQGSCGSCWAFSTTGALEALHFRQTGKLVALSEQQLVDCSRNGNNGCSGGNVPRAFAYIRDNGGLTTSANYPYVPQQKSCLTSRASSIAASVGDISYIRSGDEKALMRAVATVGPVSVAMDSSHSSFHFYRGGVYQESRCDPTLVDHALLVVGYGTDARTGMDYWLLKNSWGRQWGENGYIRVAREVGNANCCIACYAVYPNA